jgi:hypothetical protein
MEGHPAGESGGVWAFGGFVELVTEKQAEYVALAE